MQEELWMIDCSAFPLQQILLDFPVVCAVCVVSSPEDMLKILHEVLADCVLTQKCSNLCLLPALAMI